jgi:S-adenosylmethionine synthetase
MCDGIAEHVCARLCRYYLERFGAILHHNVDKLLLCGGASRPAFGGGEVIEPIEIYLAGRATDEHGGTRIPVHELAMGACREWLREHLRGLDVERHVRIVSRIRSTSTELASLFARAAASPLSNDTSCGAGFAPLTELERAVLAAERALTSDEAKRAHPELGEDVKVMGVRRGRSIQLTIGCAFVDRFVFNLDDYAEKKGVATRLAASAAQSAAGLPVEVTVNAADDLARGEIFLTVTGTSAEAGDDGEAGRGNRVSGLITPYRAMTMESAAGKNPVSHVGKLYNLVAGRIASSIVAERRDVADASCVMLSQIGRPVDDPQLVDVELATEAEPASLQRAVAEIARAQLGQMRALRDELMSERLPVY